VFIDRTTRSTLRDEVEKRSDRQRGSQRAAEYVNIGDDQPVSVGQTVVIMTSDKGIIIPLLSK
jgi:hypothetical protein